MNSFSTRLLVTVVSLFLFNCAQAKKYDRSLLEVRKPNSILVLPPINESLDLRGSYSCLSSVTKPLSELGYYVFPVEVVDEILKHNGYPSPNEMHQIKINKFRDIFNPDAILYLKLTEYGTKYAIMVSSTEVRIHGKLVDAKDGAVLWEGESYQNDVSDSSNGLGGMIGAAVAHQVLSSYLDTAKNLCRKASWNMLTAEESGL